MAFRHFLERDHHDRQHLFRFVGERMGPVINGQVARIYRWLSVALLLIGLGMGLESVLAQDGNGKLKIFILAGQSNMQGYGMVDLGGNPAIAPTADAREPFLIGGLGSLRAMVDADPTKYGYLVDSAHPITYPGYAGTYAGWVTRDDVWVSYWDDDGSGGATTQRRNGALTVGFGASNDLPDGFIGPEYGFGQIIGNALSDPVLLIKTAWGGKSLAVDFRPPSSGGTTGRYYTEMVAKVREVLTHLSTYHPAYGGQGYEISGFGWHQGWNDRVNDAYNKEYESNLVNLIHDIRAEFGVTMPFVIGNTGMGQAYKYADARALIAAQANVSDPTKHPELAGTVFTVDTQPFDYDVNSPRPGYGYHWNFNGISYFHIGESMAQAMVSLMSIIAAPTITSLDVTSGSTTGGTVVAITGTHLTGTSAVSFGGTPVTAITSTTATTVTVVSPAHAVGVVDVQVTTPGGSATRTGGFTYVAPALPPTITGLDVVSGPIAGGTTVVITGTSLTDVSEVTFGGVIATITGHTATTATVVSPAHAAGVVDVMVKTPTGSATSTDAYTYVASGGNDSGSSNKSCGSGNLAALIGVAMLLLSLRLFGSSYAQRTNHTQLTKLR